MQASSDCTGHLMQMLEDGRLEAAIVTLPIGESDLFMQKVCEDKLLICLRRDDPLAKLEAIPKRSFQNACKFCFIATITPSSTTGCLRDSAGLEFDSNPRKRTRHPRKCNTS